MLVVGEVSTDSLGSSKKSESGRTDELKGCIPEVRKPAIAFSMLATLK